MSISQILDDFDIDKKSLRSYVRDGCQMNLTPHLITCVWRRLSNEPNTTSHHLCVVSIDLWEFGL